MKTTEVNKELIGRRCECISFGTMVTGVIEDITVTKYTAEVKVRYDEPQRWGNEILHSGWAHGDKDDESGSLKYLRLLPEPVRPDYETLVVTFAEPIRTLERLAAYADTAALLRRHPALAERSVRVNIEADSVNSALLMPGATPIT